MKEQQAATRLGIRIVLAGYVEILTEKMSVCLDRLQLLDIFKSSSRTRATTPHP